MKTHFALVVLLIVGAAEAAAPARPSEAYVSVARQATGEPILVVDYPWKTHARPSIEVSTLPDDEAEWSEIRPLFFSAELMKGRLAKAVYACLDGSEKVPTRASLTEGGVEFEVLGDRNSFGKPSVSVACRTQVHEIRKVAVRALFCVLEPWAVDRRRLLFDLPREHFADPGKLRVWFLRGEKVLWSETVNWPGFPREDEGP